MRKVSNKLFACFSVLTMLLGFFLPNFTYIVNATDGDTDAGSEVSFTNVENDTIYLDMEENKTKTITPLEKDVTIKYCESSSNDISADSDGKSCVVTAMKHSLASLRIIYSGDNFTDKEVIYNIDVDFDNYFNYIYDKLPDAYEFDNNNSLSETIGDILPNSFDIDLYSEQNYPVNDYENICNIYYDNYNSCLVTLEYSYSDFSNDYKTYSKDKYITIKNEISEVVDHYGNEFVSYIHDQNIAVGEVRELEGIDYGFDNSNKYFWVSENNNVARINEDNQLVGVSRGTTTIRLVNKKTYEYISFKVDVNSVHTKRTLDEIRDLFSGDVEIDIANLEYYGSFDSELKEFARTYFDQVTNAVSNNLDIYSKDITCGEGLSGCVIDYYYYENNSMEPINGSTPTFNIIYKGLTTEVLEGYFHIGNSKHYSFVGDEFVLSDVINLTSEEFTVNYDETLFALTRGDEGEYKFKSLKAGKGVIEFITKNYLFSVEVETIFTEPEFTEFTNFIDELNELDVTFSKNVFNTKLIEQHIIAYTKNYLKDSDIANYINVEVKEIKDKNVEFQASINYNGTYLRHFGSKYLKINYESIDDKELFIKLNKLKDTIEDEYIVSFKDSVYLASTVSGDDYYNSLIEYVSLIKDAASDTFDVSIEYGGLFKYNNYLLGGVYYDIYISKDGKLLDFDRTYIKTNYVVDRDVKNTETNDIKYIETYLYDASGVECTVSQLNNNIYTITTNYKDNNNTFNILYDHKNLILADETKLYIEGDKLITLGVDQEYQLELLFSPFTATYSNMEFFSSDQKVFKVDNNGKITGTGEGSAMLAYFNGNNLEHLLVVVGYTGTQYLDSIIKKMNLNHLIIDNSYMSDLSDLERIEYKIQMMLMDTYNPNFLDTYLFDVRVTQDNGVSKLKVCMQGECSSEHIFTYEFVGIVTEKSELIMSVGDVKNINASFTQGDKTNLRYATLDQTVATVDKNGNVTAVGSGVTTLKIYDKYHDYVKHIRVEVDLDDHINKLINELKDKTFTVDYGYYRKMHGCQDVGCATRVLLNKQGYNFSQYINIIYNEDNYFEEYYDYDQTNNKVTITYDNGIKKYEIVTNVIVEYIYVENDYYSIGVDEVISPIYESYNDEEVEIASSDNEVCQITDNQIKGLKTGVCEITYSSGNYKTIIEVAVNLEGYQDIVNNLVDSLPDTIDIKLDKFDVTRRAEPEYINSYNTAVRYYLDNNIPSTYQYTVSDIGISKNGDEINLVIYYASYAGGYREFTSNKKTIKLNYLGRSDGWEDLADKISDSLDEYYILSNDEMLEYMLAPEGSNIYEYSRFINDLKDVCENCEIYAEMDSYEIPPTGQIPVLDIVNNVIKYNVVKNGEPLVNNTVRLIGSFTLDVYSVDDMAQVEYEIKKAIHESYKKHKQKEKLTSPYTMLKSGVTTINTEDEFEYDIDLKYLDSEGNNMIYDVTIDGNNFQSAVTVNVLTDKKDYTVYVENIKLNKDILNLEVGNTFKLTATVTPDNATNKNVKWSSSNNNIVTVVDGLVTAVGAGNAVITIESEDGNTKTSINVSVIKVGLAGDIDGDGKVNIVDLVKLRKHLAKIEELKEDAKERADFNSDGEVNIKDLVNMRQHLAK